VYECNWPKYIGTRFLLSLVIFVLVHFKLLKIVNNTTNSLCYQRWDQKRNLLIKLSSFLCLHRWTLQECKYSQIGHLQGYLSLARCNPQIRYMYRGCTQFSSKNNEVELSQILTLLEHWVDTLQGWLPDTPRNVKQFLGNVYYMSISFLVHFLIGYLRCPYSFLKKQWHNSLVYI